ncbi:hypothetical protein Tco_0116989 [Tanacetum coccineum]
MAQQKHAADVHPDELCPPNKRYDLMDANKKVDLEQEDHKNKAGMQIPAWMITEERAHKAIMIVKCSKTSSVIRLVSLKGVSTRLPPALHSVEMIQMCSWTLRAEKNVDDSSIPRNDESNILDIRLEPKSNKESPEVEITKETPVVDITKVVIPVNVNDEDEEITDEKLQELMDTPHTTSSSSSPHKKLAKTNRLLLLFKTKPTRFKRYKSFFQELQGCYGYLFAHLRARFMPRKSFDTLADNLYDVMVETLPTMVDKHIKEQVMKQVPEQVQNQVLVYVAEGLILESYMSGHILHVHPAQLQTSSVPDQQYQLYLAMKADP